MVKRLALIAIIGALAFLGWYWWMIMAIVFGVVWLWWDHIQATYEMPNND